MFAEAYAAPVEGALGVCFSKRNDLGELFYLRWGMIRFDVFWGAELDIKVLLRVYRCGGTVESFLVDTDPHGMQWNRHQRTTRDFFLHPFPRNLGRISCVKFSYIAHVRGVSLPSRQEYIFMDGHHFDAPAGQSRAVTNAWSTPNTYRTAELDPGILQRDADWHSRHFEALNMVPKFTRGTPGHPFHPKRYIHDCIDGIIRNKRMRPGLPQSIKICMDCIDDSDFVSHLLHAKSSGVMVQCIVDWRKMSLSNSDNYVRLKRSGIELLGVFCTPRDQDLEVAPDMHCKFLIFGDQDCLIGSFNLTFERWWANWESGMAFRSHGVCRLLDNIFQSMRGGVLQGYGVDPYSPFNLLYTFGRQKILGSGWYRPHQAIISEIHRARRSIRLCLFLINELRGDHNDSIVDALIAARDRGVDVQIVLNGHMVRIGDPGRPYTMQQELRRPVLPSVERLRRAGISVGLAYGLHDHAIPYCPIHSKYCIIDEKIVLDGSFNWYNTSKFSHDLLVVAASGEIAKPYLGEFRQVQALFRIYYQ